MSYSISTTLRLAHEEALERVQVALKEEGFGVLTRIDIKETMKQKLDVDYGEYVILGACNPPMAHRALQAETEVGLLLPCNVIVYEGDQGETVVSAVNPMEAMQMVDNPGLRQVAEEVTGKLERVIQSLGQE